MPDIFPRKTFELDDDSWGSLPLSFFRRASVVLQFIANYVPSEYSLPSLIPAELSHSSLREQARPVVQLATEGGPI